MAAGSRCLTNKTGTCQLLGLNRGFFKAISGRTLPFSRGEETLRPVKLFVERGRVGGRVAEPLTGIDPDKVRDYRDAEEEHLGVLYTYGEQIEC